MVASARIVQEGQFNLDLRRNNWAPFTAKQVVIARRPGFDWDARIRIAPAVSVFVHDAYVAGEGILDARIIGLWTLEHCRGTPETAQGELMRFLAEAPWYPTALLPTQGVRWDAIDDTSARATLTDGTRSPLPGGADSGAMLRAVACAFHLTLKWPGGCRRVQRRAGAGASSTSSMSSHDEPFPAAGGT
jgi:hypothetical protein